MASFKFTQKNNIHEKIEIRNKNEMRCQRFPVLDFALPALPAVVADPFASAGFSAFAAVDDASA